MGNDQKRGHENMGRGGRGGRYFGFRKGSARAQHLAKVSMTRKEVRKAERKGKKAKKHDYILVKVGAKVPETPEKKRQREKQRKKRLEKRKIQEEKEKQRQKEIRENDSDYEEEEKYPPQPEPSQSSASKAALKLKEEEAKLAKQMQEVRKKRLLEENEEEDRYIKVLSKKLKLSKTAAVPASFREDGLDYLLELCESGKSKKKALDSNRPEASINSDDSVDGDDNDDVEEDEDELFGSDAEEDDEENEDEGPDLNSDSDNEMSDEGETESKLSYDEEKAEHTEDAKLKQRKKKSEESGGVWEDIYGRMRSSDGEILSGSQIPVPVEKFSVAPEETMSKKYIPPMRRANQTNREKIKKSLKGLLNRLTESNMHNIAQQIEDMYMKNSRNEMNESMLELFSEALIRPVLMPDRILLEYIMVVAILHANVGTEVGAFFIQNFIEKFHGIYETCNTDDKRLENLALLSSFMYHFKIIDSGVIYDLLNFLAEKFTAKDVELILTILKSVGFRLRKDNPIALKALILLIQQKATLAKSGDIGSRVKFMLEIILAIRNNNMNKIPNYDPSFGDQLLKMVKTHLHKGNYVSEMKISMQDLLNAETKGRWWIVGSAWIDTKAAEKDSRSSNTVESEELVRIKESNDLLMEKAKTLGMNTDARRNIFCILMSAEDYLDAFEKLMRLGLKNQVERDIIHVIIYCCLQEKKFNPYYAFLTSKLCQTERRFALTTQFSLWDRLKDLGSNHPGFHLNNLSKFIIHLINEKSLPLTILKILDFADMGKNKLTFLKKTLTGILLQENVETLEEIFGKSASSEKLNLFRESLKLFMNHFLLKGSKELVCTSGETVDMHIKPSVLEKLKSRVEIAERALSMGHSRVKF